jgi:hypothetical protein
MNEYIEKMTEALGTFDFASAIGKKYTPANTGEGASADLAPEKTSSRGEVD